MCVVDVGSFASKSLTATTLPATHMPSKRESDEHGARAMRAKRMEKQQDPTIPSCTTDCLIHFNVQYKIMFDYISDVFTRLVHEMHAQLAFSSSSFANSIDACRAMHFPRSTLCIQYAVRYAMDFVYSRKSSSHDRIYSIGTHTLTQESAVCVCERQVSLEQWQESERGELRRGLMQDG